MRQIGTLPDPEQAQSFADYLLTRGITTKLDAGEAGVAVWIREEDHLEEARQQLESYRQNPAEPRFLEAAQHARQLRRDAQRKEEQFRRNMIDVRRRWSGTGTLAQHPVTVLLIAASVVVSLWSSYGMFNRPITQELCIERVLVGPSGEMRFEEGLNGVRQGQFWRLFTPVLMHGSLMHLLLNMYWLYELGGMVESRRGSAIFAALIVTTAIISNLAQYYWKGPAFLGMSGVVYGLFGYVWMKSRFDPRSGLYIPANTVVMLIAWLFICFIPSMEIANGAHLAGLAVGLITGYAPVAWHKLVRG